MKKFFLLLAVCLLGLTAKAQYSQIHSLSEISSAKKYILQNTVSGTYVQFQTSGYTEDNATNATPLVSDQSSATKFTLTSGDNGYSISNGTEFVIASTTTDSKGSIMKWNTNHSTTAEEWTITEVSTTDGTFSIKGDAGYWKYDGSKSYVFIDGTTSTNYLWKIYAYASLEDLKAAIDAAKALSTTGAWAYDATALQTLIDAAQAVYDKEGASDEEISTAIATLKDGIAALAPTLKSGRYFVQNYNTITCDGKTENPHLANHYNLMGVGSAMVSYYSIWDVTNLGDGTYTMQNEGQRYLGIPKNLSNTDGGYLGYQVDATGLRTHIGCFTDGTDAAIKLDIIPNQFGVDAEYAAIQIHTANADGNNYAAFFDQFSHNEKTYEGAIDTYYKTDDVMAGTLTGAEASNDATYKQAFLWKFTPVTAEAELNMFNDQIDHSLVGYVGGVASIDPQAARKEQRLRGEWLATINSDISAARSRLSNPCDCSAAQDEDGNVGAISYMKDIFQQTLTNRTGKTPSPLHIKLNSSEYFFFENMHGSRPCTYSRMHADNSTFYDYSTTFYPYTTVDPSGITEDNKTEFMWYIEGDESSYNCYTNANDVKTYLNNSASTDSLFLKKNGGTKLNFVIEEITPSIYVIKDKDVAENGKCYITVEGNKHLVHYNYIELSTLWKFETITTTDITLNLDPEDTKDYRKDLFNADGSDASGAVADYTNAGKYKDGFIDNYGQTIKSSDTAYGAKYQCYGTYCPAIDMMIRDNKGYKAYYVSAVSSNGTITLKPVTYESTKDGTYNAQYLSAGTGYILISDKTDVERTSFTGEIAFSDKEDAVTAPTGNLLTGILDAKTAEDKTIAVLSYVETGSTALGNDAKGNQAYGVGIGFYNLAVGKTLAADKAYIDLTKVTVNPGNNSDVAFEYESNGVAAMKFLIEDENGEETGIAELNADGTMTVQPTAIFDLSGRRVSKAQKGIYIVNGKKIMY